MEQLRSTPGRLFARNSGASISHYQGAYFGASTVDTSLPGDSPVAYVAGGGLSPGSVPDGGVVGPESSVGTGEDGNEDAGEHGDFAGPAGAGQLTDAQRLLAVRDFLREVGYREEELTSYRDMVRYTRGRSGI